MSWSDWLSLIVTVSLLGGVIYAVFYVSNKVSTSITTTKENLKSKGYTVSSSGISIRTDRRFDRESYMDATQRGFVKAVNAASFGKSNNNPASSRNRHDQDPPGMTHHQSTASLQTNSSSDSEKTKRGFFKRTISNHSKS